MSEMIPCPFCGEQPELTTYFIKGTANHTNVYASCSCGHKTRSRKGVDGAIADWNTRPIEDELRKRIAELEALVEQLIWVGNDLLIDNANPVTVVLFNGLVAKAKEKERER